MITTTAHRRVDEPDEAVAGLEQVRTRSGSYLVVFGDLDVNAVDRLTVALAALDAAPDARGVSLQHVGFADSWGLEPIVEAIRRSVAQVREPLCICAAAAPVRRVFDCLCVRWRPTFDLAAWDAAGRRIAAVEHG